jgi:hypothetical protein
LGPKADLREAGQERPMDYTTKKVGVSRGIVRAQEKRVARQREKIAHAVADRDSADALQARLLIMEQSLICMVRFLKNLERDLTDDLSLQSVQAQMRIKSAMKAEAHTESSEANAELAPAPAPAPEEPRAPFETIAKAMRKLAGD